MALAPVDSSGVVPALNTNPSSSYQLMRRRQSLLYASLFSMILATVSATGAMATNPHQQQKDVDELLAADRAFAAAAANTDLITALSAMFADDVIMGAGPTNARGRDAAITALRGNPQNATSRISWSPIRGGVSSDGKHGFTQGYITTTRADNTKVDGKYLGYWIKKPEGWRLAVYKRMGRPEGPVSLAMSPPSLPVAGLPAADGPTLLQYTAELRAAEVAFSNDGTSLGVGPAFFKWGAPDAMNAGGGAEWVLGPEAISSQNGQGSGAPGGAEPSIVWAPTDLIVAATGDLGVSIGFIWITEVPENGGLPRANAQPFFTIWKRATPRDVWRYVAE